MQSPAARQLKKTGLSLVGGYFVIYFVAFYIAFKVHPAGSALWGLALLPVLPILGVIVVMGRYLREERDEFRRDLIVRCLLWGAAGCVAVNLFSGFLRIFGWEGRFPPFAEFFVFVVLMLIAKLTYRAQNRVPVD